MPKIETLTPAQIAAMPRYVSEWLGHGLSTEPADRPRAEAAIRSMYAQAGISAPKIIWADSPLSGALLAESLKGLASVRASVLDSVLDSVRDSVWASVRVSVRVSVLDSVLDSVWASVYGSHGSGIIAYYAFMRHELGLIAQTDAIQPMTELAKSCGWIYPYRGVCIATERHSTCRVDDAGLIHCETGPAIAYPDGFTVHAWHGTILPAEWVAQRATIDPAEILKCEDVEQRAAGMAMIGWPRALSVLRHEVVDSGPNADWGDLLRVWMPGLPEPALMLKAECPRNGTICEFVPDTGRSLDGQTYPVTSVLAAQAARVFKHPDTYIHPQKRT